MNKTSRNYLLLALLFAFSFIYRVALMLRETFPPGADIGLHNSIIYSITRGGPTDFLYNYYHMGGGSSVTFPGYHIFTAYVMLLTGLPDYVAQAVVVSLFSSLIMLVAYLLTRKVWGNSAALLVAFLVAVSRFDIEMLMWGGYPNVITLMLIPLAFYVFLSKDKFKFGPFLVVSSLVAAGIFLTHSLSAVLFVTITVATVFFGTLFAKQTGERRTSLLSWIPPLILGLVLISPFLLQVAPAYLGADASTFTGSVQAIRLALLSTKVLPLDLVLPLMACVVLFFLYGKRYIGKFLSVPVILLVMWTLIPAVLTQGFYFSLYTDYNRFLYFALFPIITLIGIAIFHGAEFFADASTWLLKHAKETPQVRMNKYKSVTKLLPHLTRTNLLTVFVTAFLVTAFIVVPVFVVPAKGVEVQSFYQLMNQPEFEAIQWAKQYTPVDSLFVTDAQYGWWFGGFAERRTISAVEPEYLTNSREFEPASVALNLLDTDYIIDNGLIQVREDGGHIARHNPEFLAKLNNSYFPYPFFNFNNGGITVWYRDIYGNNTHVDLANVPVRDMQMINDTANGAITIAINWGNNLFNFTQTTTVYEGKQFAKMTESISSANPDVHLDTVSFTLHTKGMPVIVENSSIVGYVDKNMKVVGELLFNPQGPQPTLNFFTEENPAALGATYVFNGNNSLYLDFSVGVFTYFENPDKNLPLSQQMAYFQDMVNQHAKNYDYDYGGSTMEVFDYEQGISSQQIDYIALRNSDSINRFARDPMFSLVFINNDVAIFQVR